LVAGSDSQRVAWLYRIAANSLVDHARRHAAEQRAISRLGGELRGLTASEMAVVESLSHSDALHERVTAAFGELSAEQREALWLHVVEERTYAEISGTLGLSEPAVRARVSRGLSALRRSTALHREEEE
jgi:RNA polymerase sigma-70 factor (ECF subfamily)